MIPGEEKLPMTILDRVSDTPVRIAPYVDYMLDDYRATLERLREMPRRDDLDTLIFWMESFVITLEHLQDKLPHPELWPDPAALKTQERP